MSYLDEIDALVGIPPKNKSSSPSPGRKGTSRDLSYLDEIDALVAMPKGKRTPEEVIPPETPAAEQKWSRFIGEQTAKGALSNLDLPQVIGSVLEGATPPSLVLMPEGHALMGDYHVPTEDERVFNKLPLVSDIAQKGLKKVGVDLNTQVADTPAKKIVGHGAQFLGSTAGGGVPGLAKKVIGSAQKLPTFLEGARELGKLMGLSGASGLASGTAIELGANPLVSDIVSTIATPFAATGAKKVIGYPLSLTRSLFSPKYREAVYYPHAQKEAAQHLKDVIGEENVGKVLKSLSEEGPPRTGFEGTVAEKTKNSAIAQLERAHRGHVPKIADIQAVDDQRIRDAIDTLSKEADITDAADYINAEKQRMHNVAQQELSEIQNRAQDSVEEALSGLHHRVGPEEAGAAIRGKLQKDVDSLVEKRKAAVAPLYKELRDIKEGFIPQGTYDFLGEKLRDARAGTPLEGDLKHIENMLTSKYHPQQIGPRPSEVLETVKQVDDLIGKAKRAGENHRASVLLEVKNKLLKDMEHLPQEKEVRALYAKMSEPISEITEHRTIGKILDRDQFDKEYIIKGNAEIPSMVVNKSMKSIEDSKDLAKLLKGDKRTTEAVHGYINNQVINYITDPFRKVDPKKIVRWSKANQGAFQIYPHLETKLSNLTNAQNFANEVSKRNVKDVGEHFKEAFKAFSGENPDIYVPKLLGGYNSYEKIKEAANLAKTDKTGNALRGLQGGFVDHLHKIMKLSSRNAENAPNISYHNYRKFMERNKRGLAEVFDESQMRLLQEVEKNLEARTFGSTAAHSPGSPTKSNDVLLQAIQDLPAGMAKKMLSGMGYTGGTVAFLYHLLYPVQQAKIGFKNEILRQALWDPEMTKLLLTPVKEKAKIEKMVEYLKNRSSLMLPPVVVNQKREEE